MFYLLLYFNTTYLVSLDAFEYGFKFKWRCCVFEQCFITQYEFVMMVMPMRFNRLKGLIQKKYIKTFMGETLHTKVACSFFEGQQKKEGSSPTLISNQAYPYCTLVCLTYHFNSQVSHLSRSPRCTTIFQPPM